jgi:cytochrome d ubiquinol oxidase subunit I
MDVEILARIQFAFTIAFHYIYPPLSIGLGLILVIMEGMYLKTGEIRYEQMTRFWIRIFALIFGIGVATGIIMEFEFGTNWATYSKYVGDIFGSALAAEGIFAFALESGFLGILLFGWTRVSSRVHFFSTIMVFLGSVFSAIWIVVANSWQQTPAGFHIVGEGLNARAEITDFWAMVFNPSSMERLIHVWIGAILAGAFLVLSINAWYIIKGKHLHIARPAFKIALITATVFHSRNYLQDIEAPMVLQKTNLQNWPHWKDIMIMLLLICTWWGWVNQKTQIPYGLKIPGGLTFLIHQDFSTPVKGLNSFKPDEIPTQVNAIFQFYHIMVGIGVLMIVSTLLACWYWKKGVLFDKKWLMYFFVWSVLLPQIANQCGWFAAEMGRQPWVVYGLLKTSDALSRSVTANQVIFSLILFAFVYTLLLALFLFLLNRKIQHGPTSEHNEDTHNEEFTKRNSPIMKP